MTQITNDEFEKLRLNFSICTNRDVAPLTNKSVIEQLNSHQALALMVEAEMTQRNSIKMIKITTSEKLKEHCS